MGDRLQIREATQQDIIEVSKTSISMGLKDFPPKISYTYALDDNGIILCVGGFLLVTPTVGWVWMDMAEAARSNIYKVYRAIREWIQQYTHDLGITRLMAAVNPDFEEAVRTIDHLGFRLESVMEAFDDDKAFHMYVWIAPKTHTIAPGSTRVSLDVHTVVSEGGEV